MIYKGSIMTIKEDDSKQALERSFRLYQNTHSFTPSFDQPASLQETIALLFEIIKVVPLMLQNSLSPHFKVSEQKAPLGIKASLPGKQM